MMASVVNFHTLYSGRLASSCDFGFSSPIAVYLLPGSIELPSFCPPEAVLICVSSGFAAIVCATCACSFA
jgi:hypothetical protein